MARTSFPAPWGQCQRCGFDFRVNRLRKEWTGHRVCEKCWDPKPAETRPPRVTAEGLPVPNASPEPPIIEREEGDFGGEDL